MVYWPWSLRQPEREEEKHIELLQDQFYASEKATIIHIKVYKNLLFYLMKFYIITRKADLRIIEGREEEKMFEKYCKENDKTFMMQKQKKENKEMKNVIKIIKYL